MAPLKSLVIHGLTKIPAEFPKNSLLIRKPIQHGPPIPQATQSSIPIIHHGQHIYLYSHIQTNQVVYSLKRHLNVLKFLSHSRPTSNHFPE